MCECFATRVPRQRPSCIACSKVRFSSFWETIGKLFNVLRKCTWSLRKRRHAPNIISEHQGREIHSKWLVHLLQSGLREVYICPSLVPSNLCNSRTFFLSARFSSCKFLPLASSSRRPTSAIRSPLTISFYQVDKLLHLNNRQIAGPVEWASAWAARTSSGGRPAPASKCCGTVFKWRLHWRGIEN